MIKIKRFKYFFTTPFLLFFFFHYGNGQTTSDPTNKAVSCEYGSEIEMLGNPDCTKMFCTDGNAKCVDKDGEKVHGIHGVFCPALKDPEGGWTCPTAYDCLVAETPEYDEALKNNEMILLSLVHHPINPSFPKR